MQKSPEQLYQERQQRMQDAMAGRVPDRVPIPLFTVDFFARYAGYTMAEITYDADKLDHAVEKTILDFEPDAYEQQHTRNYVGQALDLFDYLPMEWPGGRIFDDAPFQYLDAEIMKADEYDELIDDPSYFFMSKVLPRTCGNLQGLAGFPFPPGMLYTGLTVNCAPFGTPEMKQAMDTLHEAGKKALDTLDREKKFILRMAEKGFPTQRGGAIICPFDIIVDFLRGSKGGMLDMMRRGDKLQEAIDAWLNNVCRRVIEVFKTLPNKTVFIPLHWGIDGFMSPKQFETFYWPQLRKLIHMVIEAGLTPQPFFEGTCTSRLETIADVPAGKCTYMFESSDFIKAKEILGDTVCIRGGMPASLLISGSPAEVEEHAKTLIDTLGKGGGYIMDASSAGIPREARVDNVKAMFDTVKTHGVY
jgi:hypothetical protein